MQHASLRRQTPYGGCPFEQSLMHADHFLAYSPPPLFLSLSLSSSPFSGTYCRCCIIKRQFLVQDSRYGDDDARCTAIPSAEDNIQAPPNHRQTRIVQSDCYCIRECCQRRGWLGSSRVWSLRRSVGLPANEPRQERGSTNSSLPKCVPR